jgi:hypothetical protein
MNAPAPSPEESEPPLPRANPWDWNPPAPGSAPSAAGEISGVGAFGARPWHGPPARFQRLKQGAGLIGAVCLLFTLGIFASEYDSAQKTRRAETPVDRPGVVIPFVRSEVLWAGRRVYREEGCTTCHELEGAYAHPEDDPYPGGRYNFDEADLTHEAQRHSDINWHILNLTDHDKTFPGGWMGSYSQLSPQEVRALASYLATRR